MNWDRQFSGGNQNPNKIYMYNARIGFISNSSASPNIYKTTNGGMNWSINVSNENFTDMYFVDSLSGWKCMPGFNAGDSCVKKTTNGGVNWIKQQIPQGGMLITSQIYKFSFINEDTIWGSGGQIFYGAGQFRGVLYRTTNGGINWLFQVPDTSIHVQGYGPIQFINSKIGWAYASQSGIHTTNGGNDTFYTGLQQISSEVPKQFKLYQNYPNPFNPLTKINYDIPKNSIVKLTIYDILGREVMKLVNNEFKQPGRYVVEFNGTNFASGVYFYRIEAGNFVQSKKMVLVK